MRGPRQRLTPALLLSVALAACATVAPTVAPPPGEAPRPAAPPLTAPTLRLPANAHPNSYAVELSVVPGEETFGGKVVIELTTTEDLNVLWLNATELKVSAARFSSGARRLEATATAYGDQFLAVVPARPLPTGDWQLTLEYRGPMSRKELSGVFQLTDEGRDYAMTQFEAIGARRAVPCFDEPGFKVPWQLTLHAKADQLAVSNAPVVSQTVDGERQTVVFAPTRPLPTYLWAFAVGPWDVLEAGTAGRKGTALRIITPKGRTAQAQYAAGQLKGIVEALERYFDAPYPYEKLDQLAMPMRWGAMEHPGLVTWGQQLLLAQPGEDTVERQQEFHLTAAHELAHQWFGDLVTMKWWDDLWLNESFAEWLQWKISDPLHPEWHLAADRVGELMGALDADALATARQIRQPIATLGDIDSAFDGITYQKGASVLSQFEAWLSPEVFQRGVREYLLAHADGNAEADDFFSALSKAAGHEVGPAMKTFTDQAGAPRLAVSLQCPAAGPPTVTVTQSRALPVGSKGDRSPRWQVPFCLKLPSGRFCEVLTEPSKVFELPGPRKCPAWVLPNEGFGGYYRGAVAVPGRPVGATLRELLTARGLSGLERTGLWASLSALVSGGDLELAEALELAPLALAGNEPQQWTRACELAWFASPLVSQEQRPRFESWVRATFSARANQLGFVPRALDDHDTLEARDALLRVVGQLGHDTGLRLTAQQLAVSWLARRESVPAEVAQTALALAVNGPDVSVKDRMLAALKTEQDGLAKQKLFDALKEIDDPARLGPSLALLTDEQVPLRDSVRLLHGAVHWPDTREPAWTYLLANVDALLARLPTADAGATASASGLTQLAGSFCDLGHLEQARALFGPKAASYPGMARALDQTLEGIELCIALEASQRASLAKFLHQQR